MCFWIKNHNKIGKKKGVLEICNLYMVNVRIYSDSYRQLLCVLDEKISKIDS